MRAWFLSLFRFQPVSLPQEMKAKLWSGPQTARVKWDTTEEFPTRAEAKKRVADAVVLSQITRREQAGQKVRPFKRGKQ